MRYLSLFSGIEAATVAWQPLGWEAVGFAEIEPFPCAVLKHYYPSVPNLGSVTDITEGMIKKLGRIDVVVFGSPCQDLSLAGKREGFKGERSGLFRDAIRIIRWARKHGGCRFALWENVPGAFSSNQGEDFAEVLRLLTGSEQPRPEKWRNVGISFGKEGLVEWRTCDAQFYGVPQRRRRIFALADFGDWAGRPPVLFESESLFGDSAAGAQTGEGVAGQAGNGTEESGGESGSVGSWWDGSQTAQTIDCSTVEKRQTMPDKNRFAAVLQPESEVWPADKTCTLAAAFSDKLGLEDQHINGGASLFVESEPFDFQGIAQYGDGDKASTQAANSHYKSLSDLVVYPIHDQATRHSGKRADNQDGKGNGLGIGNDGDPANTLTSGDKHAVAYQLSGGSKRKDRPDGGFYCKETEVTKPLDTGKGLEPSCQQGGIAVCSIHPHAIGRKPENGPQSDFNTTGIGYTLDATGQLQGVVYCGTCNDAMRDVAENVSPTLRSGNGGGAVTPEATVSSSETELAIRRLTPRECERLQGFPDDYTAIPWKNKPADQCPDGPRYKCLGNSMAVPVMVWLGMRIDWVINGVKHD